MSQLLQSLRGKPCQPSQKTTYKQKNSEAIRKESQWPEADQKYCILDYRRGSFRLLAPGMVLTLCGAWIHLLLALAVLVVAC